MIFFSCWATYIQIFFGKILNIVTTTVTNSTNVEPVSYIYIIKPTGCENNPGRVFPLDASASIPVLVFPKSHLKVIQFNSVSQCIHWSAHIVCNAIVFEDLMAKFQTDDFNNFHVTWGSICCISGIFPLFLQISMKQVRITGEYHIFCLRCHWKLYVIWRKTS